MSIVHSFHYPQLGNSCSYWFNLCYHWTFCQFISIILFSVVFDAIQKFVQVFHFHSRSLAPNDLWCQQYSPNGNRSMCPMDYYLFSPLKRQKNKSFFLKKNWNKTANKSVHRSTPNPPTSNDCYVSFFIHFTLALFSPLLNRIPRIFKCVSNLFVCALCVLRWAFHMFIIWIEVLFLVPPLLYPGKILLFWQFRANVSAPNSLWHRFKCMGKGNIRVSMCVCVCAQVNNNKYISNDFLPFPSLNTLLETFFLPKNRHFIWVVYLIHIYFPFSPFQHWITNWSNGRNILSLLHSKDFETKSNLKRKILTNDVNEIELWIIFLTFLILFIWRMKKKHIWHPVLKECTFFTTMCLYPSKSI